MEGIEDILAGRMPQEPPEVAALKQYISEHFQAKARISLTHNVLIITVSSAALANTLRLRLPQLRDVARTSKRIILRIG